MHGGMTSETTMARAYQRPMFADDLDLTLQHAWASLVRGVRDRGSPFHTPTVATIAPDGRPRMRTVVLRQADPGQRLLRFHTDLRSGKIAEIERDSRVSLHGYDKGDKFQVRVEGAASIHSDDEIADQAWAGSRLMSRACYGTQPGPGVPLKNESDFSIPSEESEINAGRTNFSAVLIRVESIETLYLDHAGHRRALFTLGETVTSQWLTP